MKYQEISKSENKVYNQLEFVDIAGLVKGQAKVKDLVISFYQTSHKLMR